MKKRVGAQLLDLFVPNTCVGCQALSHQSVCGHCLEGLQLIPKDHRQLDGLDGVVTLGNYSGLLKKIIWRIKYDRDTYLAAQFSTYLSQLLRAWPFPSRFCVPVPLHWLRQWCRGFNQVDLIWSSMIPKFGLHYESILKRTRYTRPLHQLDKESRKQRLRYVFQLRDDVFIQGKDIVICDDILTSAATLSTIADYCRQQGARNIWGFCIANVEELND